MIFLCVTAAGISLTHASVIRSDDFESYAEGIADTKLSSADGGVFQQNGRWWAIPTAPHVMEIAATTGKGGASTKAFRYRKTGESTAGGVLQIMGSMPRFSGKFSYAANIRNGDDTAPPFYHAAFAGVRFLNNGSIVSMSEDGKSVFDTLKNAYPLSTWCSFKAEYTIAADTVNIIINGENIGVLKMPKGVLAKITNPRWDFGGYGTKDGVFWIDDVILSVPDTATPAGTKSARTEVSVSDAMGFERDGAWLSVPPDLLAQMERSGAMEDELASSRQQNYRNIGVINARTLADMNAGVGLSKEHVRQGAYAGYWADHHRYPSIICTNVVRDVSMYGAFSLSIYSAVDTGQIVTVGVLSDDASTAGKDWYFFKFSIDWKGWKRIEIPFTSFTPWEKPLGWSSIGAIAFFTKAFGHQPSPRTALWLDDIRFTETASSPTASADRNEDQGIIYRLKNYDKPGIDHNFPELPAGTGAVITPEKAICHGYYFNYERAQYGYDPRFQPGYVSFDPAGKAYVWAGDRIQWVDGSGKWTYSNLQPVIRAWGKAQGWPGIRNGWGPQGCDPMIRFDNAGDVYVLANVTIVDEFDKEPHWSNRTALLLHSRDAMKTWQTYRVPGGRMANFEKLDGHNTDCLANPPVILIGDITYFPETDLNAYLVLPVKEADGSLRFDGPYKYAENAITGNFHSGDGNVAVSAGDKIFIAWGWSPDSGRFPDIRTELAKDGSIGRWGGGSWVWSKLKDTKLGETLPPVSEDHPAMKLSSITYSHSITTNSSANGVPTFVSVFDRKTRSFSAPVFVGMGGPQLDGHNWPAITIDSKGYLHVVINGHHDPFMYTKSARPLDASAWTTPVYVSPETARLSYATLTCSADDTLYTVHRSTSDKLYNNRLGFYRKKAGGAWEPERTLVFPFKYMYMVWYQRMTYDRKRDRLFLTYYSRGGQQQLSQDMYEFLIFQHPDQEKVLAANQGNPKAANHGRVTPWPKPMNRTGGDMYNPLAGDVAVIVSTDHGDTWRLAVTEDFR